MYPHRGFGNITHIDFQLSNDPREQRPVHNEEWIKMQSGEALEVEDDEQVENNNDFLLKQNNSAAFVLSPELVQSSEDHITVEMKDDITPVMEDDRQSSAQLSSVSERQQTKELGAAPDDTYKLTDKYTQEQNEVPADDEDTKIGELPEPVREYHLHPLQDQEEGDRVYLHSSTPLSGTPSKLQHEWKGPFIVEKGLTETLCKIQEVTGTNPAFVVHYNRLKPAVEPPSVTPNEYTGEVPEIGAEVEILSKGGTARHRVGI